jgi:hypothetical protein
LDVSPVKKAVRKGVAVPVCCDKPVTLILCLYMFSYLVSEPPGVLLVLSCWNWQSGLLPRLLLTRVLFHGFVAQWLERCLHTGVQILGLPLICAPTGIGLRSMNHVLCLTASLRSPSLPV